MTITTFSCGCAAHVLNELERGALHGYYLRRLRRSLGLTQVGFAERLGITAHAADSLEHKVAVPAELYPAISALCQEIIDA